LEAAVVAAYDFSNFGVIADIGGGHGRLLSSILAAAPAARGVLFDLPQAVEGAPPMLTAHGVADRVTVEGGSFFESVPSADAYVMKNVIHDWPDDKAIAILGIIKAAAPPGAKLLLLEMVVPDHDREYLGHYADMEMLVIAGALERRRQQWTDLLRRGGFRLQRVVETAGPLCIIEAVPS
jgi:O-methyltransferase